MIAMNALANALPLNGYTTGQLSGMYPNAFVPAGFTFSIWGLIYLLLLAYVIWLAVLPLFKRSMRQHPGQQKAYIATRGWFLLTCMANVAWLLCWHYRQVGLSLIIMLAFLFVLVIIHSRLGIGHYVASEKERWFAHLPFSVYLGWISVATIANFTTLLVFWEVELAFLSSHQWAAILAAVAVLAAALMLLFSNNVPYALVVVWALYGIYSKQQATTANGADLLRTVCLAGMVALAVGCALRLKKWLTYSYDYKSQQQAATF